MKRRVNLGELSGGLFKINLGYFGEGEGSEDQSQEGGNQEDNQGKQKETKSYTQEQLDALLQSETDKRVNQAMESFKSKELPKLLNGAKAEAEKLAKMNADQKAEYERKQQEEQLLQREAEVTRKELKIEAHKMFTERNLPVDLLDVLLYDSAENCNKSIDAVEKAFRQAVEKGVNERLKGETPKAGGAVKQSSYAEQLSEARKAGNNVLAIQIKQEAAQKGEILI